MINPQQPICVKCGRFMRCVKNGVIVRFMRDKSNGHGDGEVVEYRAADYYQCPNYSSVVGGERVEFPKCRGEQLTGFSREGVTPYTNQWEGMEMGAEFALFEQRWSEQESDYKFEVWV